MHAFTSAERQACVSLILAYPLNSVCVNRVVMPAPWHHPSQISGLLLYACPRYILSFQRQSKSSLSKVGCAVLPADRRFQQ